MRCGLVAVSDNYGRFGLRSLDCTSIAYVKLLIGRKIGLLFNIPMTKIILTDNFFNHENEGAPRTKD